MKKGIVRIGVLALQGAVDEYLNIIHKLLEEALNRHEKYLCELPHQG